MSATRRGKRRHELFPIVGIGASAGGLGACETFFAATPPDSGMGYVVVQHLDPSHQSLMARLLSRHTVMPVVEVADRMRVEANHVYTIPPNKYLTIRNGVLHLSEPVLQRGMRMPIDHFLRSLAEERHELAIAIILSGTGTDGTLGVKAIKGEGGIALAQSPEGAQYDGMPRSALGTGLVDYVGPVETMPEVLIEYHRHAFIRKSGESVEKTREAPEVLSSILAVLRSSTRYDFRAYKKETLRRRIERRMNLNRIETLDDYLGFLRTRPEEAKQLFKDLLISVTEFFREPEACTALERVIAEIIAHKDAESPMRIWVPGCATGEEPYTIAMLFSEQLQAAGKHCPIQVFATDVDEAALATARAGIYPENIVADVSAERLHRFFKRDGNAFRINKHIRDSVVFAVQNLIADPPFSKLDLVSCRNLLIYLEPDVQSRVIRIFHYALNEGGILFLGSAESVGKQDDLFEPLVKKWRLYRRLGAAQRNAIEFPAFPLRHEDGTNRPVVRPLRNDPARLGEFTRGLLLENFTPASVLVDRKHQILFYHGDMARYLEQPTGPPSEDLLNRVREGLRFKLRGLVHKVVQGGEASVSGIVEMREAGATRRVRINVTTAGASGEAEGLLLVSFADEKPVADPLAEGSGASTSTTDALILQLERELQEARDDLHSTVEEMEYANEGLRAANEEVMSVNEELQSTNEELETSKEELQSLNEELSTVNNELEEKVRELEMTNNDLDNLLSSTDIATIFLDHEFHIKRFTPASTRLFNLIASDCGRPVSDISRKFDDPDLLGDAARVLNRLAPIEAEVHAGEADRWYNRHILPYRTQDNRIEGVVITFMDITERKRAAERLRLIVEAAPNAVVVVNAGGHIELINARTEQFFGYDRTELIGRPLEILVPERFRSRHAVHQAAFYDDPQPRPMGSRQELFGRKKDGSEFPVEIGLSPVQTEGGMLVLATILDITERKRAAHELRQAKELAETANFAKSRFLASASHDMRQPLQTISLLNAVLQKKIDDPGTLKIVGDQGAAVLSMRNLLDIFLDLCRIDAGAIKPEISEFPLADVLGELQREFKVTANTPSIRLRVRNTAATVRSDPRLLRRIVQNFVSNALTHAQAGRVLVGCRRRGGRMRIEVWDTGPGIPREHLEAIFEEFIQLNNPARQSDRGFGVGLSVARSLAHLLEHRIDVRSTPGKGSMFAVEVPLVKTIERERPGGGDTQASRYEGSSGSRVLVVEDDPTVLAATRQLLESLGLSVIESSGAPEALTQLKAGADPPDMVIADYRLPEGGSGVDLLHNIQDALGRKIPAVLVTGDTLPESVREMGASGYTVLRKPVAVAELVAYMNRVLSR